MSDKIRSFSATAEQMAKVIHYFVGVTSVRLHNLGFPLLALVVEYLKQENPKRLNLLTMRQVFGLSLRAEQVWAMVDWLPKQGMMKIGQAIIGRPVQPQRTRLVRLWPEDLGLTREDSIDQVIGRALEWGYKLVPALAVDVLVQHGNVTPVPGWISVPLDQDVAYEFLEMRPDDRRVYRRDPTQPVRDNDSWSVVMAY